MKYMGSKRAMLQNGLGELLTREANGCLRFIDLFTGSGAVAIHVGTRFEIPVFAFDLQKYSVTLADAVISRTKALDGQALWDRWYRRAYSWLGEVRAPEANELTRDIVTEIRDWCSDQDKCPVTQAYGGYYFSAHQAMWIDALRLTLPTNNATKTVALAALIQAASQCAASPGHTAQPFQPTVTGKRFLEDAWRNDIPEKVEAILLSLSAQHVLHEGYAAVCDANDAAYFLREGDLVFIDPPYSGVHYSRFYHVLETIANGKCGDVSGTGRYPAANKRPRSKYSVQTESADALEELFETISYNGAKAIVTFPDHSCSNGLSGDVVRTIAAKHFDVSIDKVKSKFSTLGGIGARRHNVEHRAARHDASEMMLVLEPK